MKTKRPAKLIRSVLCVLLVIASSIALTACESLPTLSDPTVQTTQTFIEIPTDREDPADWETPLLFYTQTSEENRDSKAQAQYTNW